MAHLGILLAFDHFPELSGDPRRFDAQLHVYLASLGHAIDRVTVFKCHDGELPPPGFECDLWIVSGAPALWQRGSSEFYERMLTLIRRETRSRKPLYGLNRGEHVLHDALCPSGAAAPETSRLPTGVRNPFWSFWLRDRLHALSQDTLSVKPLPRSEVSVRAGFRSILMRAA